MIGTRTPQDAYSAFVAPFAPRLTQALVAALGGDLGREMAAEALAYGWEHWERVQDLDNPEGYLYRVGLNRGRRRRRPVVLPDPRPGHEDPRVEPGLGPALARLSRRQRVSVMLVHGAGWTLTETGRLLGISAGAVSRHVDRALRSLRTALGVTFDD
jgi:RNA polymerase sigma-70 factor (ECF subfamily)